MYPFIPVGGSAFTRGSALTPHDQARLVRIERKLDAIIKHLGIELPDKLDPALSNEVKRLADAGFKSGAIEAHRAETGDGLPETDRSVEDYLAGPADGPR
jgi:hypothetical protein